MYERSLFVTAACFNWVVGLLILVDYPLAAQLLSLRGPPTLSDAVMRRCILRLAELFVPRRSGRREPELTFRAAVDPLRCAIHAPRKPRAYFLLCPFDVYVSPLEAAGEPSWFARPGP